MGYTTRGESRWSSFKRIAEFAAIFVAALLFFHGCDFSWRQGLGLAILAGACYGLSYGLFKSVESLRQSRRNFHPYSVWVEPNWGKLLLDYRLIKDAEDYRRWHEVGGNTRLIGFTVLKPQHDCDLPGLIYRDVRHDFVTWTETLSEPIEGMKFTDPFLDKAERVEPVVEEKSDAAEEDDLDFVLRPVVFFALGGGGYEMGLIVRDSWWEWICATGQLAPGNEEIAKTEADTNHLTGETRLTIATLPASEFDGYYHEAEDLEKLRKWRDSCDKQLTQNGWTRKESRGMDEPADPWERLKHKYFTVQHRGI